MKNNQKKKSAGSATIPGLHNLEKKLETFQLEKTVSKLKTITSTSKIKYHYVYNCYLKQNFRQPKKPILQLELNTLNNNNF